MLTTDGVALKTFFKQDPDGDYQQIGLPILYGIACYCISGAPIGGFLTALLSNDLKEACHRADYRNRRILFNITKVCWNVVPSVAWGSADKGKAWHAARNAGGKIKRGDHPYALGLLADAFNIPFAGEEEK